MNKGEGGDILKYRLNNSVKRNFMDNFGVYFLVILFFAIGISAGAFTIKAIDLSQKEDLVLYFNRFLQVLDRQAVNNNTVLLQSVKNNFQTVVLTWFLGITVIGIPLTILIVLFRGFMLGFTVGFLIEGMGWRGLLLAALAIIPQNIIYVTCLIIICVLSLSFSFHVLRSKMKSRVNSSFKKNLTTYTLYVVILFLIMCIGSIIEAYLSPYIIKLMSGYLIVQ